MGSIAYQKNKESIRRYRDLHRDELLDYLQRYNLNRTYGISREELEEMIDEQDGRCLICGVELLLGGHDNNSSCIDHDHETGKIRGILCRTCNRGIGLLKDNVNVLRRAADYIERNKE